MTIWQRWKKISLNNKLGVIFLAIAAIAAVVTPIVQAVRDEMHRREDRRPVVINNRPPEFLQPFTCDPKTGLHFGNMRTYAKNTGKTAATNLFPIFMKQIVPEKKTGISVYDDLPPADCSRKIGKTGLSVVLPPDQELQFEISQGAATVPPLSEDTQVQLYATSCFYYQDSDETNYHAVCDTYRLGFSGTNPLDKFFGSPTFMCDGNEKMGKFTGALSGHCAN